jgi:hypothetical protein
MSALLIKHTTTKTVSETKKYNFHNKYICTESVLNGKLVDQYWQPVKRPKGYQPDRMIFHYYPNPEKFLEQEADINTMNWKEPDEKSIKLLDNIVDFADFDKLYCLWIGMDGNIYRIDDEYPIPVWRYQDYISGVTNEYFDLKKAEEVLRSCDFVRNVKWFNIPSYNCTDSCNAAVEFSYKLPTKFIQEMVDKRITNMFWPTSIEFFDPIGLKGSLNAKASDLLASQT